MVFMRNRSQHTHREKGMCNPTVHFQGKVFPEEAVHWLPLRKAPLSPVSNAEMQSAMGGSSVIPIQESWGDTATGIKKYSQDGEAMESLSSRRWDALKALHKVW